MKKNLIIITILFVLLGVFGVNQFTNAIEGSKVESKEVYENKKEEVIEETEDVGDINEKSNEYKGQYHMGIKFPSLTPIKNPELKVINVTKENFQTNSSRNYDKAKEMFGQSLIREVK